MNCPRCTEELNTSWGMQAGRYSVASYWCAKCSSYLTRSTLGDRTTETWSDSRNGE